MTQHLCLRRATRPPLAAIAAAAALSAPAAAQDDKAPDAEQKRYYTIENIATPEGVTFEAGAMGRMPGDRIAVATRHGDVYLTENPFGPIDDVSLRPWAAGLEEPLGHLVWKEGWLYATEQTQLVRIKDADDDGTADIYQTFCDDWGVSNDDYHEYTFLAPPDADGNFWVTLCLTGSANSDSYLRGWAVRVTPDGEMWPSVAGVRSPGGMGYAENGELFYNDNQGLWNGTNGLKHLKVGSHQGNPSGNKWWGQALDDLKAKGKDDLAEALGPDPGWPADPGLPEAERARNPHYLPPAVLYPLDLMGRSPTGIVHDTSGGAFGPFAGQMFVGEVTHSMLHRVFLEEVNGVQQGACFPFLAGFMSGPVAVTFAEEGFVFVGQTDRGWGSRGGKSFGFERVKWTGETPFEVHEIRVTDDGWELTFTQPADPATAADPKSYAVKSFIYWLQSGYGSPEIEHTDQVVTAAAVADDGLSVRLTVEGRVKGHVHEIKMDGVRSAADPDAGLWHPVGYYTLNELP